MRHILCTVFTLFVVALVSIGVESACSPIPSENCRGVTVNAKPGDDGEPDDHCTECVEANCCDLVGDCQGNECATQVAQTHACVIRSGRRAAVAESDCKKPLGDDTTQSSKVYACMRRSCGESCSLPTCRLEPLVPSIGKISCDRCFAQSCCPLMNACAQDRTCLLALRCIIDECRADFARELRRDAHDEAVRRRDLACGDAGSPPRSGPPGGNDAASCFARCIQETIPDDGPEAINARCLAAQINECGSDVDCGELCAVDKDASTDASTDGPSE